MRTINLQIIIFSTLLLFSCSKMQQAASIDEAKVVESLSGKWKVIELVTEQQIADKTPVVSRYDGKSDDYYEFRNDGKVKVRLNGKEDILDYRIEGNKVAIAFHNFYIDDFEVTSINVNELSLTYAKQLENRESVTKRALFKR